LDIPEQNKAVVLFLLDKVLYLENLLDKTLNENATMKIRLESLENHAAPVHPNVNQSAAASNDAVESDSNNLADTFESLSAALKETQMLCTANSERIQRNLHSLEGFEDTYLSDLGKVNDHMDTLERKVTKIGQYTRRENLVIDGIPNSIPHDKLEATCVRLIKEIGFQITSAFEIQACHRLGFDKNGYTPVIIRFTNRKVKDFCISQRARLQKIRCPWNISFREDLETENAEIEVIALDMKEKKVIKNFIIRNGFVKIFREGVRWPTKIDHVKDLRDLFPEYFSEYYDHLI
jgi:hypothetical protein